MAAITPMQKAFSKSKLYKRLVCSELISEDIPLNGYRRLFNKLFKDLAQSMPEPQIKLILLHLLKYCELTDKEIAEALALLQLSQTALTTEQREIISRI